MNLFITASVALLVFTGCLLADAAKKPKEPKQRTKKTDQGKCVDSKVCLDVIGKSGKIRAWLGGKKGSDSDAFTLLFDYIHELDADKKIIKGKAKHSFNNFAKTEFAFSELEETTIQGIKAYSFDFQATLDGPGAVLTVTVYIIREEKDITLCDNSVFTLKEAVIKYNVEIKNWKFCGDVGGDDCGKNVTGKYIDFGITMKRKDDKAKVEDDKGKDKDKDGKEKNRGKKFGMGPFEMAMPEAVEYDGTCGQLADISLNPSGSKQLLNLRFKRFNNFTLYDPFISGENHGSHLAANLSFILMALMAVFIQFFY